MLWVYFSSCSMLAIMGFYLLPLPPLLIFSFNLRCHIFFLGSWDHWLHGFRRSHHIHFRNRFSISDSQEVMFFAWDHGQKPFEDFTWKEFLVVLSFYPLWYYGLPRAISPSYSGKYSLVSLQPTTFWHKGLPTQYAPYCQRQMHVKDLLWTPHETKQIEWTYWSHRNSLKGILLPTTAFFLYLHVLATCRSVR